MHIWRTLVIVTLGVFTTTLVECANKAQLPYILQETHHAVAGRIAHDALDGEHVMAILEVTGSEHEGHVEAPAGEYLQIKILKREHAKKPMSQVTRSRHPLDITGMVSKTSPSPKQPTTTTLKETNPPTIPIATFSRLTTGTAANNGPTKDPVSSVKSTGKSHKTETHVRVHITNSLADLTTNDVAPTDQSDVSDEHAHSIHVLRTHRRKRNFVAETDDSTKDAAVMEADDSVDDVNKLADIAGVHAAVVTEGSSIFGVGARDGFLYVRDSANLAEHELIEFYVYLADSSGNYISNPLPFLVYIDRPEEDTGYPAIPAVFAGVLVLFIVFLALFIPFVTRAKRRYKQGKPMFKLGSNPSTADLVNANFSSRRESEQSWDQLGPRRESKEPNWYGNAAFYNYEDEVRQERDDFTRGIKQTYKKATRADSVKDHTANRDNPPTLQIHKKSQPTTPNAESSAQETSSRAAEGTSRDMQTYDEIQRL